MQSSNPVFRRAEGFNGSGTSYADFGTAPTHQAPADRMTIDSVVQRTGMTVGLMVLVAAIVWVGTGDVLTTNSFGDPVISDDKLGLLSGLALVGAFGAFALSLVNSFKKVVSPPLVLAFAALEGLVIGAISKLFQLQFGPGVVTGAVIGTIAAVAGTLAAYKFFEIRVGSKFRTWVIAMMFGFVGLSLLDFVLHFFGADFGFNGFGTIGLITSFIGLALGVLLLILDFDYVERGIAAGLPERESWRAAFGITVAIVWIYIELLRILAILRGD